MIPSTRLSGRNDLAQQVRDWLRMEEANPELKRRVAAALDDIKAFVEKYRSNLEKRRGKLVQTSGFKEETRSMEAAVAGIHRLLTGGRNISAIFAEIDAFLDRYRADETFAREHTRVQLAGAREEFLCAFHDSIRGTRLAGLLDVLFFMPYSCWRSRGVETRNYRSPSAAEVLKLLEELAQGGVDVNGVDPVALAAVIRTKLGVTPRMDYHLQKGNKLAEKLTGAEAVSRFTSREVPLDEGLCRTAGRVLDELRRWSDECFGGGSAPAPPEIEAEMVQIVFLAGDTLRISGTGNARAADYLWLLSTVVACAREPLRDALAEISEKDTGFPSVRTRIVETTRYLDAIAVSADRNLLARWSEAREELTALAVRADAIVSKSTLEFGEFTELDTLKEGRSDAVKSLIKITEALRLLEPTLLAPLPAAAQPVTGPQAGGPLRAPEPGGLKARNRAISEETATIARQELEKLRSLIARITAISRKGLADAAAQSAQDRLQAGGKRSRRAADGAEMDGLSVADLHGRLLDLLRRTALSLKELKDKADLARKRGFKSDLQHTLHLFSEKVRAAAESCESSALDSLDTARAPEVADRLVPLLREIMSAQTNASTRVGIAKLNPAEKQPLLALLHSVKARVGDDLRDMERIRAELAERSADARGGRQEESASAAAALAAVREEAPAGPVGAREAAIEEPAQAQEPGGVVQPAREVAGPASAASQALKSVKDLMVRVSTSLSSGKQGGRHLLGAAQALKRGITEARDLVTLSLGQVETTGADRPAGTGDVGRLERWNDQLLALDRETDRLLKVGESFAALETAVQAAVALEAGIADTVKLLSVREVGVDDVVPLRERCVCALETTTAHFGQLRETQGCLAEAAKADWRVLRAVSGYLEARRSELPALESALKEKHSRVRRVLHLLESHWKLP